MLFPTYNSNKKNHKMLSWNLFRVKPYFDWTKGCLNDEEEMDDLRVKTST